MVDVSNQIAPIRVKENSALYYLTSFFCEMIELQKTLNSNEIIEIEGRLGSFTAKHDEDHQTNANLNFIQQFTSKQGMHIIGDIIPNTYKFNSDVPEFKYERALKYLEQLHKANAQREQQKHGMHIPEQPYNYFTAIGNNFDISTLKQCQNDLILDMVLGHKVRISYYVNKGTFEIMTKELSDQSHIRDIMHNGICYRVGAKKERLLENQDIAQLIQKNPIQLFRFKQRKSFSYQFMEISCTRVLQISKQENMQGFQELLDGVNEKLQVKKELNRLCLEFFGLFFLKKDPNRFTKRREIEVEIKDLKSMFSDQRKIVEMKLRAFLKNLQVLDQIGSELMQLEETEKFKKKLAEQQIVEQKQNNQQNIDVQNIHNEVMQDESFNFQKGEVGEYMEKEIQDFILRNKVPNPQKLQHEEEL